MKDYGFWIVTNTVSGFDTLSETVKLTTVPLVVGQVVAVTVKKPVVVKLVSVIVTRF